MHGPCIQLTCCALVQLVKKLAQCSLILRRCAQWSEGEAIDRRTPEAVTVSHLERVATYNNSDAAHHFKSSQLILHLELSTWWLQHFGAAARYSAIWCEVRGVHDLILAISHTHPIVITELSCVHV